MLIDRDPESLSLFGIVHGVLVGRAGEPHRSGCDHRSRVIERSHRYFPTCTLFTQTITSRHLDVFEIDRARVGTTLAHVVFLFAQYDAV